MTMAEKDGRTADYDLYKRKLNDTVGEPLPSSAGASQALSDTEFAFYKAALEKDKATKVKLLDAADKMFATDLGYLDAAKMCGKMVSVQAMYRPQLNVGITKLWRGKPGKMADLQGGGQAVWAGLRFPIKTNFSTEPAKIAKGPISAIMAGGSLR